MEIKERILEIIQGFGYDTSDPDFYLNMDSVGYINSLVAIETEYDITFPDDAMAENIFISMDHCADLVRELINAKED